MHIVSGVVPHVVQMDINLERRMHTYVSNMCRIWGVFNLAIFWCRK